MTKRDAADMLREEGAESFRQRIDQDIGTKRKRANGSAPPVRFKLTPFEQIQINTAPNYVVKGIIPRNGLVVFWGPPKCGKSFLCFDIAMHIALGRNYRGRRVQGGPVIYLALEGSGGFAGRVEAWRRFHLDSHDGPVPFYLLDVAVDIIADHVALIEAIRMQTANPPTAVFIDTLNRGLAGDENKSEDMAKFIRAADAIRHAFGCAVVLIHHCGIAGTRPRGHTSLSGADDAQVAVARDSNELITVTVEHMKDGPSAPPFACRFEPVDLGPDDEGASMSSCVIVDAELPSASKRASIRTTGNQDRFLDILRAAIREARPEDKATDILDSVSREWLKKCLVAKGWLEEAETNNARAKLSNMINALAGKRLIGASNLYVWSIP